MLACDCPSCLFPPVYTPVLAELQQAGLISSEECKMLDDPMYVVGVQSGKSSEVLTKTADVLRRQEFEEVSRLLAGKHADTDPQPCTCGVLYSGA